MSYILVRSDLVEGMEKEAGAARLARILHSLGKVEPSVSHTVLRAQKTPLSRSAILASEKFKRRTVAFPGGPKAYFGRVGVDPHAAEAGLRSGDFRLPDLLARGAGPA